MQLILEIEIYKSPIWDIHCKYIHFKLMGKIAKNQMPRHGYISEIAKLCNCSRKTVSRALFEGYRGPKADMVLKVYNEKYENNRK